ncbi:MAG: branched-chain amino acid ABC transporter permease [Deltaproteobacteria bacterium]|nr:branched-chain amino acid ABC transporter permease [Deltaproteobacteria bacterium]
MGLVFQTIANSLVLSCFYILLTVGLTLVFGVMKTANYAHGEFYMLGAYTVWFFYAENGWPFFAAVAAAVVVVGLLGLLTEQLLFRPMRGNILSGYIISIGLVFIMQVLVAEIFGKTIAKQIPAAFAGSLNIGSIIVGWQRVIIIPIAIITITLLYIFLNKSKIGKGIRASAFDGEAASLHGISATKSAFIALGIGSGMAGLAGALMAPIMSITPYMGTLVIMMCFVIIIVGGPGNLKGAIIASILFGFLNTTITFFFDSVVAMIVASLVMGVVLSIKPEGIMGYAQT